MTGLPILDSLKHRSPEMWAAMVAAIRHGRKVSRSEGTVQHDDGRVFPIGLSTTTFDRDADGRPSVTAIFTDISDLKQLQELNLRAERLEAVAALSASLGARDSKSAGARSAARSSNWPEPRTPTRTTVIWRS